MALRLALIALLALAVRLYLALTSFCISGDGPEYLRMAREFAAGRPLGALGSVFSPLYPLLVAWLHPLVGDWELAGELVSVAWGTLSVVTIGALVREVFDDDAVALGAALLAAIHPELAEYAASVRTEAGFVCLMTGAAWLFVAGGRRRRLACFVGAGVVGGLAYLYRAEGIGLLMVCEAALLAGAVRARWGWRQAVLWAGALAASFLAVGSPYLGYLRWATGHWSVSRELNVAAASSVMELTRNRGPWLALAGSGDVSLLAPWLVDPWLYLRKIGRDSAMSVYYFSQAMEPVLTVFLLAGLWTRGRTLWRRQRELFLLGLAGFYLVGFSLFNTGPRFMTHLIPYGFGWVVLGLGRASQWLEGVGRGWRSGLGRALVGTAVALLLLPRTLWPLGYDQRGLRYAGREVARRANGAAVALASSDARAAFYAGARYEALPGDGRVDLCAWLCGRPQVAYLLLSSRDERRLGLGGKAACLSLLKRYPRYGNGRFDLFVVVGRGLADRTGPARAGDRAPCVGASAH